MGTGDNNDDEEYRRFSLLTPKQLQQVQAERQKTGQSINLILARLGIASESEVKNTLELQYGVNYLPLSEAETPVLECLELLPEPMMRQYQFVPVLKEGSRITIAMINPIDLIALDAIKMKLTGTQVKLAVCTERNYQSFMEKHYP